MSKFKVGDRVVVKNGAKYYTTVPGKLGTIMGYNETIPLFMMDDVNLRVQYPLDDEDLELSSTSKNKQKIKDFLNS